MNEAVARDVLLVRAIETTDRQYEILSEADRLYASRSARELAQWQAADLKSTVTVEHFLQQRAEQILKRITERTPAFSPFVQHRTPWTMLSWLVPLLALLCGAGVDRIGDPHRVDLLSAPLLLIIGWNLLVYLGLLICSLLPTGKNGWLRQWLLRKPARPKKLPHVLSAALLAFLLEWTALSRKLNLARLGRIMHSSAALFAAGAILSLYARGFLTQYTVGWESTFLDAAQVHAILSLLFWPAITVFSLPGFSLANIEALSFGAMAGPAAGASWVHLTAATLFLLVVLPRLLLAALAGWGAWRLAERFPLDLDQPYFRKLDGRHAGLVASLTIFPYSFTLDQVRIGNLDRLASALLDEPARALLQPSCTYGEELPVLSQDLAAGGPVAVLFNLAATPEQENHGLFLDHVLASAGSGLLVLIDESAYLERLGKERIAQRITLWREFCHFHQAQAAIVNLLSSNPAESEAP